MKNVPPTRKYMCAYYAWYRFSHSEKPSGMVEKEIKNRERFLIQMYKREKDLTS
jgi:hypothetical protein